MFWKILKWVLWPAGGAILAMLSTSIYGMPTLVRGQSVMVPDGPSSSYQQVTMYVEVFGLPVYEEAGPRNDSGEREAGFWWITPIELVLGAACGAGIHALLLATSRLRATPRLRPPSGWRAVPIAPTKWDALRGFFVGAVATYLVCAAAFAAYGLLGGPPLMFGGGPRVRTWAARSSAAIDGLLLGGMIAAPIAAVMGGVIVAVITYRGISLRSALVYAVGGLCAGLLFGMVLYFIYPYAPHRELEREWSGDQGYPDKVLYDMNAYAVPFMLLALLACAVIAWPRRFAFIPMVETPRPSALMATGSDGANQGICRSEEAGDAITRDRPGR
jgi:hypothetical protein